jgi:uncharacterized membrane protein
MPESIKKYSKFENTLHQIFEFGVLVKGFNGIWETVSGFLILFLSKDVIARMFSWLASGEMLEYPRDFLINFALRFLENLSHSTQIFIAVYILIHGLLNLFLAIALSRDKIWAYLATITVMVTLMFYQVHRIILHHSPVLILVTTLDIFFIILTWHEYNRKKYAKI